MSPSAQPSRLFLIFWALLWGLGIHYFQHNPGGSGLDLPFNSMSWILLAGLISTSVWQILRSAELHLSRFAWLLLLVIGLLSIPYLYPNNELAAHSLDRHLGLFAGWLFFVALQQLPRDEGLKRQLLLWVMLAVTVEAVLGLVQYYLLTPGNWIGYNTVVNRPYGIFQQPNVAASFLATGVMLALYLLPSTTQRWMRAWLYLTTFAAAVVITLLQSRAGYIGLGIGGALLFFGTSHRSRYTWLLMVALGITAGLVTFGLADSVARSMEALSDPGARKAMYLRCLEMIAQKPWLGWGYGSFERVFLEHQAAAYQLDQTIGFGAPNLHHPHNELLYWGVEGGILPLVAIWGLAGALIYQLKAHTKALLWLGLLAPLAVHCMLEYPFYHALSHWLLFVLILWLIDTESGAQVQYRVQYTFALKVLTPIFALLVVTFMATNLHTVALQQKFETQNRDPEVFTQVMNPFGVNQRLMFNLMITRYQHGLQKGDANEVAAFVQWADEFVQYSPRVEIYANWAQALALLGHEEEAAQVREQALFLYPRQTELLAKATASQAE